MNNFDRYLSDINPDMLQDMARKRRLKNLIYDIFGGVVWFGMIGLLSYWILSL